jgi:hypothetical protein
MYRAECDVLESGEAKAGEELRSPGFGKAGGRGSRMARQIVTWQPPASAYTPVGKDQSVLHDEPAKTQVR